MWRQTKQLSVMRTSKTSLDKILVNNNIANNWMIFFRMSSITGTTFLTSCDNIFIVSVFLVEKSIFLVYTVSAIIATLSVSRMAYAVNFVNFFLLHFVLYPTPSISDLLIIKVLSINSLIHLSLYWIAYF